MKALLLLRPRWLLLVFVLLAAPGASLAQATKIFVASYGNDANDGSRGSPKRNFQPAHDAVASNGQIVVLDTAGYGALSITKSLAVTVPPGVNGFITASGTSVNGITINTASGDDTVSLRGLIVEGAGSGGTGVGILVSKVGYLVMEDCTVARFNTGISHVSTVTARLVASGCRLRDLGTGVRVQPPAGAIALDAVLHNSAVDNATTGISVSENGFADSSARLTARHCAITHCATGAIAAGSSRATIGVEGCTISGNTIGFFANTGEVAFSKCTVTNNNNGAFTVNGGKTVSFANNTFFVNGNDGVITSEDIER